MSRPFPLAGLLRVRAMAEDTAAAELAAARRTEHTARDRAARTTESLGAASVPGEADRTAWQAAIAARAALSSLLREDIEHVHRAQDDVGHRQQDWTAARVRTRAVERLRDKHEVAGRAADERAEQAVLDEVASRTTDPAAPEEDA